MIRAQSQITNPSFEIAGAHAGEALGWTVTTVATYEELAFFTSSTFESFEDWDDYTFAFDPSLLAIAIFNNTTTSAAAVEAFEAYWLDNHHALFSFQYASLDSALWNMTLDDAEDFEAEFDNDVYLETLNSTDPADFDTEEVEDFEDVWNNDTYLFLLDGFHIFPAVFDASPEYYENFEEEWSDVLDGF